jgi:hypothetical protein
LEQRTRLVDPYLRQPVLLPGGPQHAAGGAESARGERPGVAVRERPVAPLEALGAELRQPAVGFDLLTMQLLGQRQRIVGFERLVDRPAEVDRCRPRLAEQLGGLARRSVAALGQGHAISRRQPDRRRAADRQRANASGHLLRGVAA